MPTDHNNQQADREARQAAVQLALHDAVIELMNRGETFTELSVEELIQSARISRSTFYVYFEDKSSLLQALVDGALAELVSSARSWWEMPIEAEPSDLLDSLRPAWNSYRDNHLLMAAATEGTSYDPEIRARYYEMIERTATALADHIDHGQSIGYVNPSLDSIRTAEWLTWMCERGLYLLYSRGRATEHGETLLRSLSGLLWKILYQGYR